MQSKTAHMADEPSWMWSQALLAADMADDRPRACDEGNNTAQQAECLVCHLPEQLRFS
jgi:hypothetical protein